MGATENYDISWKNFESRMSHSFADIRNHEQFLDVTLAADTADGSVEALRAHKVILSACSPVLRTLLTKQQALTPYSPFMPIMLYLRGISARDLNHVLEFIYKGSVSLAQDELNDFLAVAESLQIPLGEEAGEPETKPVPTKRFAPPPGGGGEPSKRAKMIPPKPERKPPILPPPDDDGDDIEVTTPQMVKMEPSAGASGGAVPAPPEPEVSIEGEEYDESYEQYGDDAFDDPGAGTSAGGAAATKDDKMDLETLMSTKVKHCAKGFVCLLCERIIKAKHQMKRHLKDTHMKPRQYKCPLCNKILTNRSIEKHMPRYHPDWHGIDIESFRIDDGDVGNSDKGVGHSDGGVGHSVGCDM